MRDTHESSGRMAGPKRKLNLAERFLMLFALLTLAGFAHAQSAPPRKQTATLSDGTVVTLEGVTYGKERRFGGMAIEPPSAGATMRPDTQDAIILWIRGVRPAAGPTARMGLQPGALRIYDETGKECVACELAASTRYLPGNAWPRSSAQMVVEIPYAFNRLNPMAVKFRVSNPHVSRTPPFPPTPAPITRSDAELEVTLEGLHQMPPPTFWSGPGERLELLNRGQKLHTMAGFRYRFRKQNTTEWLPTEALVTDAAGNPYTSEASSLYQPPRYPLTYYRSDSSEPLKLAVWFQRTANAGFSAHEVGTINSLPMRYGSYLHTQGATARIGDVTVELSSIGEVECVGKRTLVTVNVYGGDPHLGLLIQVRNERGKSANGIGPNAQSKWITGSMRSPDRFRDEETANPSPHRCADFMMDLPRGTSRITCTIAVNRAHYFEFTPTPTVLQDLRE